MNHHRTKPRPARLNSTAAEPVMLMALTVCISVALPTIVNAQDFKRVSPISRNSQTYSSQAVTLDYEGFTTPKFDILVAATEIGRLATVNVHIGDRVNTGDVIAQLEDGLQSEAVASAQWRAQMHGETDAAKAETRLMKLRLEQLQSLAKKEMARPDELKRAIADWEIAKSRELSATEQDQLRKLELSRYHLQLQRRKIKAPMNGIVAEIFHSPGEYITPADPAVIRLVVIDQLYGIFNVPAEEIGRLKIGDQVSVFLLSASKSVAATVASIAPGIDGESGTIKVRVLLENSAGALRSGDRCRMKPTRPKTAIRHEPTAPRRRSGIR